MVSKVEQRLWMIAIICGVLLLMWATGSFGNPVIQPEQPSSHPEYLTREIRYSENFKEEAQTAIEAMKAEYGKLGCLTGTIVGFPHPEKENVIVFLVSCVRWRDETKE